MSATGPHQVFQRTIEAVWRIESARVIAGLTRLTRDVGLAEDLAQEALLYSASLYSFHGCVQSLAIAVGIPVGLVPPAQIRTGAR